MCALCVTLKELIVDNYLLPNYISVLTKAKQLCAKGNLNDVVLLKHGMYSSFSSDKMGIKTTVQEIIASKQNMALPDPKTYDDFLKCESTHTHI